MPDISMCQNSSCELRKGCFRYLALPNPYHQSYAYYTPDMKCFSPTSNANGYPVRNLVIVDNEIKNSIK